LLPNATPSPEMPTFPLHDALPISSTDDDRSRLARRRQSRADARLPRHRSIDAEVAAVRLRLRAPALGGNDDRASTTGGGAGGGIDRKSTRLNSSHVASAYGVFCLK